jgi:hypothetical protein
MAAWLIVSLNTQTLGPNAATVASGQAGEDAAAGLAGVAVAVVAVAARAGAMANPDPASAAAASNAPGRRIQRATVPRRGLLAGRAWTRSQWRAARITSSPWSVRLSPGPPTAIVGLTPCSVKPALRD